MAPFRVQTLVLAFLWGSTATAQEAPPNVVTAFAAFLGTWEPELAPPAGSPRAQFYAERYTPGPRGAVVWFTQGPHRSDGSADAVPGYYYRHPVTGRIHYTAFNTLAGLAFEGYISAYDSGSYDLFYTVHYPSGARVPDGAGTSTRQFRDVHRLVAPDLMELETWVLMPDGSWRPFSPAGAVSRFRRVAVSSPKTPPGGNAS
jgi:hypothetical protein